MLLSSQADGLKSRGQYEEADKLYQQAIAADPTWPYPPYQRACNFQLWDRRIPSVEQFTKAMELGFDDFPVALGDNELGSIRERREFETELQTIRERYVASSPSKVGQPVAFRPQGETPKAGWPVILLLHGYGDTNLHYFDQAELWVNQGFIAVAVPGSVPNSDGHYQWDFEDTDVTHGDLQAIVKSPLLNGLIDPQQVYLLGFSQGAAHALLLTAQHPDLYAGAVGLSPGPIKDRVANPQLSRAGRPSQVVFIHGASEPHAPWVAAWKEACASANWKFKDYVHPGGHQFPANWQEMQPEIAAFLRASRT